MKINEITQYTTEINMIHNLGKDAGSKYDYDEFIGSTTPVAKVKGYIIHRTDEDEDDGIRWLVKDPDSEGFLGEFYLGKKSNKQNFYHSEVFFDTSIQGKGLAVPLYAWAIKRGYDIVSDTSQTPGSKSLWARLAKTPGIHVYAWNISDDTFFHWDPEEDLDSEVYYDRKGTNTELAKLDAQRKQLQADFKSNKVSKSDYNYMLQQINKEEKDIAQNADSSINADIRLVATMDDLVK